MKAASFEPIALQFMPERSILSIRIYFPERLFLILFRSEAVFITVYPCASASSSVSLSIEAAELSAVVTEEAEKVVSVDARP